MQLIHNEIIICLHCEIHWPNNLSQMGRHLIGAEYHALDQFDQGYLCYSHAESVSLSLNACLPLNARELATLVSSMINPVFCLF